MATIEHLQDRARGHELATIVKTELTEVQHKRDTSWHDEFPHYVRAGTALLEGRRLYPSDREFGEWISREGLWEFGDFRERHALMRLAINADRIRALAAVHVTGLTNRRTAQSIIKGAEDLLDVAQRADLSAVVGVEWDLGARSVGGVGRGRVEVMPQHVIRGHLRVGTQETDLEAVSSGGSFASWEAEAAAYQWLVAFHKWLDFNASQLAAALVTATSPG